MYVAGDRGRKAGVRKITKWRMDSTAKGRATEGMWRKSNWADSFKSGTDGRERGSKTLGPYVQTAVGCGCHKALRIWQSRDVARSRCPQLHPCVWRTLYESRTRVLLALSTRIYFRFWFPLTMSATCCKHASPLIFVHCCGEPSAAHVAKKTQTSTCTPSHTSTKCTL